MPDDRELAEPDAPPTEEEREAAERLRLELEGGSPEFRPRPGRGGDGPSPPGRAEAELAVALRAAWEPSDLSVEEHRSLVQRAESALDRRSKGGSGRAGWGSLVRVTFGRAAVVALAASVLLVLWRGDPSTPIESRPVLAASRSTQALFQERFAPTGGETARIDRIAMARAADLRDNEFAKWGVR